MKDYKTFEDLKFEPRKEFGAIGDYSSYQAIIEFDNGYGASVLLGTLFYSNGVDTYEIACLRRDNLCYPEGTSFEDDVLGYRTKEEITELMKEIQDFPTTKE